MNVYLYVLDTMADWEYGFLIAELNSKRFFRKDRKDLKVVKVGSDRRAKISMGGISVVPDMTVGEMNLASEDFLILPGAERWLEKENEDVLVKARESVDRDGNVAAICGATFGLARHGALDSKLHTSNDKDYLKMICPEYRGERHYRDTAAVNDRNLITAPGVAPIEFTYEVLKNLRVFSEDTLENWYQLYRTKEAKYFFGLMKSLEQE